MSDMQWISSSTFYVCIGIVLGYWAIIAPPTFEMALLAAAFIAADRVRGFVSFDHFNLEFTMFSTSVLLCLTVFDPGVVAIAAIAAALASASRSHSKRKFFVNFVSLALASLMAVGAFFISPSVIIGIVTAGIVFDIVNSISLIAGISFFTRESMLTIFKEGLTLWWVGIVPILSAFIGYILFTLSPPLFAFGIFVWFALLRPNFVMSKHGLRPAWNYAIGK
jgi:hypothetical protein